MRREDFDLLTPDVDPREDRGQHLSLLARDFDGHAILPELQRTLG